MTAQPPAPAGLPTAGAGLPAALDRLHDLVDGWLADRPGHEHYARHWRDRKDGLREGLASGRVQQINDCARDVRNLLNDLAAETTETT